MRVYIQVKQLGKRKCCIEKLPVDFSVPPTNVQELIASIVSWQVSEYNDHMQQDRKSTRLNSSHKHRSRMPSSA